METGKVVFVYAVPSDGTPHYDLNTVASAAQGVEDLLGVRTEGYGLRVDRDDQGRPTVAFVRLRHSTADFAGSVDGAADVIGADLAASGFPLGNVYAVYYDGTGWRNGIGTCGLASTWAQGVGRVALVGVGDGSIGCWGIGLTTRYGFGREHSTMLHELLHAFGLVRESAPHYSCRFYDLINCHAHVADDPTDLMCTGSCSGHLAVLDRDRQDYWWDLISSPFVVREAYYQLGVEVRDGYAGNYVMVDPMPALMDEPVSCTSIDSNCEAGPEPPPDAEGPPARLWYRSGTTVSLTAHSIGGFFTGWGGACSGRRTCQVPLTSHQQVTATFVRPVTLRVKVVNQRIGRRVGSGRVAVLKQNACRVACEFEFEPGSRAMLVAAPRKGSRFVRWGGSAKTCGGKLRCTLQMRGARTASALFAPRATKRYSSSARP